MERPQQREAFLQTGGVLFLVQEGFQHPVLFRRQRGAEGGPALLQAMGSPVAFPGFQAGNAALVLVVFLEGPEESFHEIGSCLVYPFSFNRLVLLYPGWSAFSRF